jgi:glycerate dehydrogenase
MESLPYYDRFVKEGVYAQGHLFTHHGRPFSELSGMQFGIIGMGTIGKKVAAAAAVFGARIWYYSTSGRNTDAGYPCVPLSELIAGSDVVSIHCPLNEQTHHLIRYAELSTMKKSAYLINAGRGGIIHEGDLAKALDEELLAGAALDVLESEPPDPANPLLLIREPERLLITPHIAWASRESRERLVQGIARNIAEYLEME